MPPEPHLPAEDALDRFLSACTAAGPVTRSDRIGVAVSGGPDSLALLLLALGTFGEQVEAVTVDHRIRPESAGEVRFVADICATLDVPHTALQLLRKPVGGNLSAKLRELRYAQLREWATRERIDWLMTGHHADDQRETLLMRLNRAAGVGGLAGIRARNQRTLRPLLGWRRAELAAIVAQAGLTPIDDPTNHDEAFDRARLRKVLAGVEWLDPLAVSRSAAALDQADEALSWAARRIARTHCRQTDDAITFRIDDLPAEIERRIILGCLRKLNPDLRIDGPKLARFHDSLRAGKKATLDGVMASPGDGYWTFSPAPPRRTTT